jgi:hypothetical protein
MRPYDQDLELSTIVLGTTRSPGVVTINGADRELSWDIKPAKGQTGASSTLGGQPLGEFECEFYLADDGADPEGETDFDQWEKFQRLIWSTVNGPKPVALPIYHPDLARNNYTEVVLRQMGNMTHDGRGGASVKVKFGEHRPPKPKPAAKATAKPYAADPANDVQGTGTRADPNEDAKEELAGLLDEANKP